MLTQKNNQFPGNGGLDLVPDPQLIEAFEIRSGGESSSALVGGDQRYLVVRGVDGRYRDGYLVTFHPGSPGHALAKSCRSVLFVLGGRARGEEQQRGGANSREHKLQWAEFHSYYWILTGGCRVVERFGLVV